MVVTATYEDHAHVKADKNETIANNALTFSPTTSTALTTENTAITITFSGKSTSQAITVNAVYAITIDGATVNGTVAADKSSAIAGATINLTASPSSGYVLDEWNVYKTGDSSTKVTVTNNSFTMPAYGVTVSATFAQNPTIGMLKSSISNVAAAGVSGATESDVYELLNGADNSDVDITCDGTIVTAASKAATAGNITYTVAENTGAARDGWIKVQYSTEEPHQITVSQLAGAAGYILTLSSATNGTIAATVNSASVSSGSTVAAGETVSISATPSSGYRLKSLSYNDGSAHDITSTKSFTMPSAAVTVSAVFESWGEVHTSGVTIAAGSNSSTASVVISNTNYSAIKCGTTKNAGAATVTVPSGATKLYVHIAGWNGENNKTVNITPAAKISKVNGVAATSLATVADTGVSGSSSSFTLAGTTKLSTDYFYVIDLTGITASTVITFTANAKSNNRFVIWGCNAE